MFEDLGETFSEKEGIVSVGYAVGLGRLTYGLNLKSVSQDIGGAAGSSMGVDAGAYYRPHRLLSVGASVQNLVSPKITLVDEEEELVRSLRAGLALRFFSGDLLMTSDLVQTKYMDTSFRMGLEAWPAAATRPARRLRCRARTHERRRWLPRSRTGNSTTLTSARIWAPRTW